MASGGGFERLVGDIERLGTRALPYADLHGEITDRIRTVFFNDHLPAIVVRTPLDSGGHLEELGDPVGPLPEEPPGVPPM